MRTLVWLSWKLLLLPLTLVAQRPLPGAPLEALHDAVFDRTQQRLVHLRHRGVKHTRRLQLWFQRWLRNNIGKGLQGSVAPPLRPNVIQRDSLKPLEDTALWNEGGHCSHASGCHATSAEQQEKNVHVKS